MSKEEIDKILEYCMNNEGVRSRYTFIDKNRIFKNPRDFIELLFLYGTTVEEIRKLIKEYQTVLRKEKLTKINNFSKI
jgi:hypothetical protein